MNVINVQRLLATCVEVLVREGYAAEADEAIRQGRQVAARLGPYAGGGDDEREAEIRSQALADAGLVSGAPILMRAKP